MKRVPNVIFKTRVRDTTITGDNPFCWQDMSTDDIFKNRNIALFSLPGAFTPTCSNTHLPGYEAQYDELLTLGIDEVYCLSVNDAFTMFQWSKHLGIDKVKMLPDGNADFTRLMGMLVKKENLGFGYRSWRYSMHAVNGEIKALFAEDNIMDNCPDDPFKHSDVSTFINYLQGESHGQ